MATAREESNPYDGVSGAGGKFRKRPFRRTTKTTPYDRPPPTSIRNPSGNGNNGWLSKLVDPARRLITSSAHRLFASVFTKRLGPPPPRTPQPLDSETNQEPRENQPEATSTVPSYDQGATIGCETPINHTKGSGVADLEEILKQKTFTRSEIDRLTSLLRTKGADISGRNEEKSSELSIDKKEEFPKTPVRENVLENHLISTPVVSSTQVIDDVFASTAELGKAYMGSRTPKVSVSRTGLQSQVPRGELTFSSNKIFPSMSSTMSLVPTGSARVGSLGNSFVTPRSRGRSAIYNMARSPYSRSSGTASDAFGGPSSSQTAWEQHKISGSRQGVLKRRSSLLDNDIGTVGPIRRVRQKSNLLSSRNLSPPASPGPLSAHVAGTSSAGLDSLPDNRGNNTPGTNVTTVSSKSSQTASKILQHLEMLVSPVEKSPTKLSLSMLHGQALKSLENVDSSKFLENLHDTDKLSGSGTALPGFHDSVSHKHDKVKENGSKMMVALHEKPVPAVNGADSNSLTRDNNMPSVKAAESSVIKSAVQQSQPKSWGFQMSAHEDYLDLDDDDYPNGPTPAEGRGMVDNSVVGSKSGAPEAKIEKPSSLSEVKPISGAVLNQKPDLRTSDGLTVVEKNGGITFPVKEVTTSSLQSAFPSTPTANKDDISSHSNASDILSVGEKNAAAKKLNAAVTTFGFASTNVGEVSSATGSSGVKLSTSSGQTLENSSSLATTAPGTTNNMSDKTNKDNNLNGIFCGKPEAAVTSSILTSSAGSIFNFGASTDGSTLNNGSLASSPFSFSSTAPALVPSYSQSSSEITATISGSSAAASTSASATVNATVSHTSSPSVEASIPSFTAAPVFKFSSSGDQSTPGEATKSKTQDTNLGNAGIFSFGSTSPFTSSGSSTFGGTSEVTNAVSSSSGTSVVATSSGNSSFGGISSTIANSGSGFFSSTFSTVTSTGNGIFGRTSAPTTTGNGIFGGTSATTSTGNGIFGGTSATTSTGNGVFGGTSATTSTGNGVFGGTSATTSTGNGIFGGTSATTGSGSSIFGGTSLPIAGTGSSIFGSTTSAIASTGSSIFGFSAPAASTSTTSMPLPGLVTVNTSASAAGTGIGTSTQSMPIQFSSSASSPAFGLAGSMSFSTGNSMFGSSASVSKPFGSGPTFGMSSSSETNSLSSNSGIASGTFGSNWQAPKTPVFGSSPSGFSFGSSTSVSTPSSTPTIFGSSTCASSSSLFSFTSAAAATPSQPMFGNTSPGLVFGSMPSSNNDQMEDSMAEDTVQASPTVTTFGQQPISPPASGFSFGAPNPPGTGSFQYGSQPSIAAPQNPSPFLASGSLEFGAGGGGSFSLGTSGGDKSARRIVKVRKQRKR